MKSIWYENTSPPWVPPYRLPSRCEVAVLGAGLSGMLLAYKLGALGIDVVVMEAEEVGAGQSGRTTGKVTLQRGLFYEKLLKRVSRAQAQAFVDGSKAALEGYQRLIEALGCACDMERAPALLYTLANRGRLEAEAQAARSLGIKGELTKRTELPFPIEIALSYPMQMKLNPVKLLYRLKEEVKVVEHTRVTGVHGRTIETTQGAVLAERIVFAAHYPLMNLPAMHFLSLTQSKSYSIALDGVQSLPNGMYYGIDKHGFSLAAVGGHLVLCGGTHPTGEDAGNPYQKLRGLAKSYYPQSRVVAKWSAQDVMSPDGLPLIGRYSHLTPDWYLVTGHSKWGMLGSMLAADMLKAQIMGEKTSLDGLLSPLRIGKAELAAGGKMLGQALRGYARRFFYTAKEAAEELPMEYGAIVTRHGVKMGLYRDKYGVEWAVDPVCSHLGCAVSWNAITRTWDCPCHGSRFDYKGQPLDDPAIRPLTRLNPKTGKVIKGETI